MQRRRRRRRIADEPARAGAGCPAAPRGRTTAIAITTDAANTAANRPMTRPRRDESRACGRSLRRELGCGAGGQRAPAAGPASGGERRHRGGGRRPRRRWRERRPGVARRGCAAAADCGARGAGERRPPPAAGAAASIRPPRRHRDGREPVRDQRARADLDLVRVPQRAGRRSGTPFTRVPFDEPVSSMKNTPPGPRAMRAWRRDSLRSPPRAPGSP